MPTYVYHCDSCESEFEAFQKFSDDPLRLCPQGHESVRRVFTPAGIIFKGSGWYIKDSKTSNGAASTATPGGSESKGESKGEPKGEAKPESKSEAKPESSAPKSSAGESA